MPKKEESIHFPLSKKTQELLEEKIRDLTRDFYEKKYDFRPETFEFNKQVLIQAFGKEKFERIYSKFANGNQREYRFWFGKIGEAMKNLKNHSYLTEQEWIDDIVRTMETTGDYTKDPETDLDD